MKDDRLNRLKTLPVPPPSEKAKLAALEAAMAAFDAAGEDQASEKQAATQGSPAGARPKTGFIAKAWSWFMDTPFLSRPVMATLIILPVAGFVALQYLRDHSQPVAANAPVEQALKEDKSEGADLRAANEQPATEPSTADDGSASVDSIADARAPIPVFPADEAKRKVDVREFQDARRQVEGELSKNADRSEEAAAPAAKPQIAADAPSDGNAGSVAGGLDQPRDGTAFGLPITERLREMKPDPSAPSTSMRGSGSGGGMTSLSAPSGGDGSKSLNIGRLQGQEMRQMSQSARQDGVRRKAAQGAANAFRPIPMPERERDVAVPEQLKDRDRFEAFDDNAVKTVADEPVTTFSVDVDTASYAFVRRSLESGRMPPHDAVRVEELINYFSYNYPAPESADEPFRASVALYPTPWNPQTRLMHIGIKGYDVTPDVRPASNLVFLIDVSGSMNQPDKLPLLKNAFRMLVGQLGPQDTVSIVTYAGQAGVVLEPTEAKEKRRILAAIDNLRPGGSTAGAAGIEQAYALADEAFKQDGVNRVILATDGDFNVGISDPGELKRFIEKKRKSGTFLSVLGFGQGNYNDALMQSLAQNGNGVAAYIDSLNEAQKVLVEEASANLFPIAKDVKIQIEFNPARVSEYRLIGYETRALRNQDFANDKVDAGDIGSGHTVTAIYELTLAGSATSQLDERRYAQPSEEVRPEPAHSGEFAFLKLRYKLPDEDQSKLVTLPVTDALAADQVDGLSDDMRFAAAVAAFGQKLRGNRALDDYTYDEIADLASSARGADPFGYRGAFLALVRLAGSLDR